jgi:serine/threonine protein kinase
VTSVSAGTPESAREGEILAGRYQLVRKLGEGGMGLVYEARHVLVGRHFAVKLLHRTLAQNREAVLRFHREAQAAGALDCENVVDVTDFGFTDDGSPYMVMELLKGETSRALIEREGMLPVPRAVHLLLQAANAIGAAHARGIIHRDLKPDNVFVTRRADGTDLVKVLDFGIAKLRSESQTLISTQAGQMMGTLCYMPAEQVRGDKEIDQRADIYALGAILYECLTGRIAHPGAEAHHVIYHVLHEDPVAVDTLRPGLPEGLGTIVHTALSREARDRYQSAAELSDALLPYAGAPLSAGRASAPSLDALAAGPALQDTQVAEVHASAGTLQSTEQAVVSTRSSAPRTRARAAVLALTGLGVAVLAGLAIWALWGSGSTARSTSQPSREVGSINAADSPPRAPAEPENAPQRRAPAAAEPQVTVSDVSATRPSVRPNTVTARSASSRHPLAKETKASPKAVLPARTSRPGAAEPAGTAKNEAANQRPQPVTFERSNPYQ